MQEQKALILKVDVPNQQFEFTADYSTGNIYIILIVSIAATIIFRMKYKKGKK